MRAELLKGKGKVAQGVQLQASGPPEEQVWREGENSVYIVSFFLNL